MRIVIVAEGGDPPLILLLTDVLQACCPSAVLVSSPTIREARGVLPGGGVDLVIFNAMSVLMAANSIRQEFPGIPMVLLSGSSLQDVPTRREDLMMLLPILGRPNVVCVKGISALLQLLETQQGG